LAPDTVGIADGPIGADMDGAAGATGEGLGSRLGRSNWTASEVAERLCGLFWGRRREPLLDQLPRGAQGETGRASEDRERRFAQRHGKLFPRHGKGSLSPLAIKATMRTVARFQRPAFSTLITNALDVTHDPSSLKNNLTGNNLTGNNLTGNNLTGNNTGSLPQK